MAQDSDVFDDRFYVNPFGTFTISDNDRNADNGWGGGLGIGRPIHPNLNLELRGSFEHLNGQSNGPGDYRIWNAGADVLFFFRREGFQPFLLVGAGGIHDNVHRNGNDNDGWSFMANAGAGFLIPFSDYLAFRADGRYRFDTNSGNIENKDNFGDWVISAGLQIPLGEKIRAPAPTPVAPQPTVRTFELSADTLFAFDKATLKPEGVAELDRFLRELSGASYSYIVVTGFTDPFGTEAYNLQLSERRANTVMDYLVSRGVPADRIRAEGRGKTQLKVTEADCRAQGARTRPQMIQCFQPNRRVEVAVTAEAPK
jgi:OOP family OmpA-OmpF porin